MQRLLQHRVFADHYQFYIFDSNRSAYDTLTPWDNGAVEKGYSVGKSTLGIFTVGHMNDHRVDIFMVDNVPDKGASERFHILEMDLPSGKMKITSPAYLESDEPIVEVAPGRYRVFVRAHNLGHESEDELPDEEHLSRLDLERYEIFLMKS